MAPPPIATFPPATLRQELAPEEWQACLDAWISLAQIHLRLSDSEFVKTAADEGPLVSFLTAYFQEVSHSSADDSSLQGSKASSLRKSCFLLTHRILSESSIPPPLLGWPFLTNLCQVFPRSKGLREILQSVWKRKGEALETELQKMKNSMTAALESSSPEAAEEDIERLCHLLHVSPDAGELFLTGAAFPDSLSTAYSKVSQGLQSKLVLVAYLSVLGTLKSSKMNYSLLSDHLYALKIRAEQDQKAGKKLLLADLVTNTPFLVQIRDTLPNTGARAKNIAASLSVFQQSSLARPKNLVRRKIDKGKARADDHEYADGSFGAIHVHRMSLVSQIQDLFPELGAGFVVKLLDEYKDDVEQVTAHLLDDSLPAYLNEADRTAQLSDDHQPREAHFTPGSTPPPLPERRNIFDNDEFDNLAVDASRLHIGRKNEKLTADAILSDRKTAPNKAAILSALAAFDSDDDERDDTYDAEDVGGTVDTTMPGNETDVNEDTLFKAYAATPGVFGRDADTRRSKARAALKSETGMTDEAIEGWSIMIGRDPRRLRRLEMKFSHFSGQQRELPSTAYRASPADSGTEGENTGDGGRGGRGGFPGRGRGRGRGRGGRGGSGGAGVAGASDDKNTQAARQHKEASKGSRANHNRRDQRARKMARGGFPG
ncbi:uncharacterized protein BDZ99DRAFT_459704 [Mytilinidion resinicola]|uniref:CUE domain-containing protein n=1 Tax=Mytilinidion resinicola TaxID=574789 RepID=A0A6A6Z159_9PEZI|nr:uncharacterized protein BDZ99DRAFT_459704 [Mytilinidion resinicola]KAF2813957.1 hypothetical protein BDZ99DRAFT_459704 [Mytilinidion resinicola]